jgi:putative inorganic carbon (HCO3(-)) transporter
MNTLSMILQRTISICLFFLLVLIPLMVNPTALDYWYKPKIESIYGLISIIIVAVFVRFLVFRNGFARPIKTVSWFLILYCCCAAVSTIGSIDRNLSLKGDVWRYEGVFTIFSYALLTFIFAGLIESRRQAEQLLKWLLVSTFLIALYGIIQYLGFNPTQHFIALLNRENVIRSTIGNGNFLGKFFVLTAPVFAGYCLYKKEKKFYILCLGALTFVLAGLVISMARASWLGFACASLLFLCMAFRYGDADRKKYAVFFGAAIAGALLVLGSFAAAGFGSFNLSSGLASKTRSTFNLQEGEGSATRLFVWSKAVPLILERPWFGYGPDTHEKVYKRFNLEYSKRFNNWVVIDRAHNNYIDMAIALGLAGIGAYLSIIGFFLAWLCRNIRNETDHGNRILLCSILAAYAGYLINDFFSFSVVSVSPTFWALMGLTFSLQRLKNA